MDLTGYVWRRFNHLPCRAWWSGKNSERKATILESIADMLVQWVAGMLEHVIEGTLYGAMRTGDALKATISDMVGRRQPGIYQVYQSSMPTPFRQRMQDTTITCISVQHPASSLDSDRD
jgi:hypothetical protein